MKSQHEVTVLRASDDPAYRKYNAKFFYFPARSISLLQPGSGHVVLPTGSQALRLQYRLFSEKLGLDASQAIWVGKDESALTVTSDSELSARDLVTEFLVDSTATAACIADGTLCSYAERPELTNFAAEYNVKAACDSTEWKRSLGHKGILHPQPVSDSIAVIDELLPGILKPRGYLCSTAEQLVAAYKLLAAEGIVEMLLKPINGSDGEGIEFISIADKDNEDRFVRYAFLMGPVNLEEKLELDRNRDGSIMSVVIHFFEDELFGAACDQLLSGTGGTNFTGTICPSLAPTPLCQQCEHITQELIRVLKPKGPGGVDFLFVAGKPFLVDINAGRFNGGHYPKAFHMQYAQPGTSFIAFKHMPGPSVHLTDLWRRIEEEQLDFMPMDRKETRATAGEFGLFPLVHLPGDFGMYIAVGSNLETCTTLKQRFLELHSSLLHDLAR